MVIKLMKQVSSEHVTQQRTRRSLHRLNTEFYNGLLDFSVAFRSMKRSAGRYRPQNKEIVISTHLLEQDAEMVKRTLKHELAHAAVHQLRAGRKKPHGPEWHEEMQRLGVESPSATHDLQLAAYRYVFQCESCGSTVGRFRRSKFVTRNDQYRCGECKGRFQQIKP